MGALPAFALSAGVALAVFALARGWFAASVELVALYMVTPVGKELWIPLAHARFGMSAAFAAGLLLMVDVAVCLFCLGAIPIERLVARLPRVGRRLDAFARGVHASRFARRSLAGALWVALLLPVHSGGAVIGTLVGRGIGLTRLATFAAVVGAVALRFAVVLLAVHGYVAWTG